MEQSYVFQLEFSMEKEQLFNQMISYGKVDIFPLDFRAFDLVIGGFLNLLDRCVALHKRFLSLLYSLVV